MALVGALLGVPAAAQTSLSLDDAVTAVLQANPEIRAARAAAAEAKERIPQAQAGFFPRVDLTESWQRGDQPVFVFGSLLAQRQFAQANFAIDRLNYPDALANFRTAVTLEQMLFDGGRTPSGVTVATLGHRIAEAAGRQTVNDLVLATTRAYGQVLIAGATKSAAAAAVKAAEEDARLAADRRDAGLTTDADVLALQVHVARMRERAIIAASDETIARADLNRLMDAPLDRDFAIKMDEGPAMTGTRVTDEESQEERAMATRPELDRARLQLDMARAQKRSAEAAWLPQVAVQGAYEWNGGHFSNRAGAWAFGALVRWNVFSGGADLAKRREAVHALERAEAEHARLESLVRLELRTARERLAAARAREAVGQAMVEQARESQRIVRDRYEAGLATAGDLLRAAQALVDAETERIGAVVDVVVSLATVRRAAGTDRDRP